MTKRKIMLVALSLCMVAILAMGGTLAYLTDDEAVKNTMTLGDLDITLVEYDDQGNPFEEEKYTVIPGKQNLIPKNIVTILSEDSTEAYVRTIILIEAGDVDISEMVWYTKALATQTVSPVPYVEQMVNFNGANFYAYSFYPQSVTLQPGESYTSINQVWLDERVTSEQIALFGENLNILAISQAVQATGNEVTAAGEAKTHEAAKKALDAAFGEVNYENVRNWFASVASDIVD